ncbi:MAG: stage III sporulation protein AE [Firmicutes bacterium]|nr:stage III sporulation protein AE [Bacillota bacterium]
MAGWIVVAPSACLAWDDVVNEQLKTLDMTGLESFLRDIDQSMRDYFPNLSLAEILQAPGEGNRINLSISSVFSGILRMLAREVVANLRLLGQLIVLAVLCTLLMTFSSGFEAQTVTSLAHGMAFAVLAIMGLNSFHVATTLAVATIENMTSLMYVLMPVLFTALAAVGGVATVAAVNPIVVMVAGGVGTLIKNIVFPLILLSITVDIVGRVFERVQVGRLAGLLRDAAVMSLGFALCIFLGIMSIRGIGASVGDGVSIRAAKFVSNTFVPVVGKMFSDAVGVVAGCSLLIQSAASIAGLLGIVMVCLHPIMKLLAVVVMYKVAGAVTQPLGDERLSGALNALGNGLMLVLVTVASVALVFFVCIAVVVALSNITVAIR